MSSKLPYKVECMSNGVFFELIAAFNCEPAARHYAKECSENGLSYAYRVLKNGKVLCRENYSSVSSGASRVG